MKTTKYKQRIHAAIERFMKREKGREPMNNPTIKMCQITMPLHVLDRAEGARDLVSAAFSKLRASKGASTMLTVQEARAVSSLFQKLAEAETDEGEKKFLNGISETFGRAAQKG